MTDVLSKPIGANAMDWKTTPIEQAAWVHESDEESHSPRWRYLDQIQLDGDRFPSGRFYCAACLRVVVIAAARFSTAGTIYA